MMAPGATNETALADDTCGTGGTAEHRVIGNDLMSKANIDARKDMWHKQGVSDLKTPNRSTVGG